MEKVLIVYFSHTGSNRYLAKKLSNDLSADIAAIKPKGSSFFVQLMLSQLKFSFGINKLKFKVANYDKVVLVGPIWTGKLIAPLRAFLKFYREQCKTLYFLTCCGSKDSDKDGKWGYGQVFNDIDKILGNRCIHCAALPIALVLPPDKQEDDEAIMNTRLSDENFNGEIEQRYQAFVEAVK